MDKSQSVIIGGTEINSTKKGIAVSVHGMDMVSTCNICCEEFEKESKIVITLCDHIFHEDCLR